MPSYITQSWTLIKSHMLQAHPCLKNIHSLAGEISKGDNYLTRSEAVWGMSSLGQLKPTSVVWH